MPAHVTAARNILQQLPQRGGDINFASGYSDEEIFSVDNVEPYVPASYEEAVAPDNPWREKWIEAMASDVAGKQSIGEDGTWTLVDMEVPKAKGRNIMKGKWTYTIKWNKEHTVVVEFKARWVAKGFTQIAGEDYQETFSATLRGTTLRCFISEAARNNYVLNGLDVVKAFPTSKMPDELYIEQPHGFEVAGKACRLNQALEGTKQAAHLWQKNLSDFLVNAYGMTRSLIDPCLYTRETEQGRLIVIIWVDDFACASSNQAIFDDFYAAISKWRTCKRVNLDKFIGIEITRDENTGSITLCQKAYIEKLFKRHLSERNTKPWKTPVGTSRDEAARFEAITHAANDAETAEMTGKSLLQLLGGILFASCMTRPDVAYPVAFLCQFMQNPSPQGYDAALGVLSYMYETRERGLTYGGPGASIPACPVENHHFHAEGIRDMDKFLIGFSDSSFGKTPYPFGGGVIMINGSVGSYFSRKCKFLVPDSSAYAELHAIVEALKEAIFVNHIQEDMFGKSQIPLIITDNKAAYDMIKNPGATKHSKHIERWVMFARDAFLHNRAKFLLTGTANMMADSLTKVTDRTKFYKCRDYMMNA